MWLDYLRGFITKEQAALTSSETGLPQETPEQIAERERDIEIFLEKSAGSEQSTNATADLAQEGTTTEEQDANQEQ